MGIGKRRFLDISYPKDIGSTSIAAITPIVITLAHTCLVAIRIYFSKPSTIADRRAFAIDNVVR